MSVSLKGSLHKLRTWLDGLQLRERNIVLILALVVLVFVWDLVFFSPVQKGIESAKGQMTTLANQMTTLNGQLIELAQLDNANPNKVLQTQKQQLNLAIEQLDSSIEGMTGNLIPATKMVQVLEDVLQQSGNLQLVRVKSLPVRKLMSAANEATSGRQEDVLYLHAVELQLRGSYFEALRYLQALETLPWQVIWDQLEYQVIQYPQADIRLRINTLSGSDRLLGV